MRSPRTFAAAAIGAVALVLLSGAGYYATSNYMASGTDWEVGGTLNVVSGGKLTFAGVDQTAALATAPAAVAAGYKVAQGETALGGSNPTAVTTGLATITACAVTIKSTSTPGVGTSVVTYGSSTGTMNLYGWKVTNSSTTTMIASTGTETIGWVCFGT